MLKKDLFFIQEGGEARTLTPLCEDEKFSLNIPILEENRRNGIKGGTVFRTILQEANVLNKNKRTYKFEAIDGALKEESTKINDGSFIGELDHPADSDPSRFTKVELKNSCFRILQTSWDGNVLHGICETLCNTPGKDMQALILENGMKLGFSLRAMGKTNINPQTGLVEVVAPMRMFCYDCVSNPSHANARMSQIVENELIAIANSNSQQEALMENESQMRLIAESYGFDFDKLVQSGQVAVTGGNGMALMKLDDTTIKTFVESENTLSVFLKAKSKYFI